MIFIPCLAMAAAMALAACSQPAAPSSRSVRPVPSADSLVAAIQAAGERDDSVVHVAPLHAPGVDRLLEQARYQESARHYKAAAGLLDQALKISPKAPDILQHRAQLAVRLGNYAKAEQLARRSFKLGPKVGSLCARNWQTVLEMRRIAGKPAGVKAARKHLAGCEEAGPVRM